MPAKDDVVVSLHPDPLLLLHHFLGLYSSNGIVYKEMMLFVFLLRLYEIMSVSVTELKESSTRILFPGNVRHTPGTGTATNVKGIISISDASWLPQFVKVFRDLVPPEVLPGNSADSGHIANAVTRYSDALVAPQSIESRLAAAIMGLEALLLTKNEQTELVER